MSIRIRKSGLLLPGGWVFLGALLLSPAFSGMDRALAEPFQADGEQVFEPSEQVDMRWIDREVMFNSLDESRRRVLDPATEGAGRPSTVMILEPPRPRVDMGAAPLPLMDIDPTEAAGPLRDKEAAHWERLEARWPEMLEAEPSSPPMSPAKKTALLKSPPETREKEDEPLWRRYAVPSSGVQPPFVAVVIDDLGVARGRTREVLGLPGPLTTSFLSYARDLSEQAARARNQGHELLVHVPMEPRSRYYDPGPGALKTDMSAEEILENLAQGLDGFKGYVGINNHMGSRFTSDREKMDVVMKEVKRRGLLYLDSLTTTRSVAGDLARKHEVPFASRRVFLDNTNSESAVFEQLEKIERLAHDSGSAIAIGHPRGGTIRALARWIPTLPEKGISLVPLSKLVETRRRFVKK